MSGSTDGTPDAGHRAVAARIAAVCEEWREAVHVSSPPALLGGQPLRPGLRLGVETIHEGWSLHHAVGRTLGAGSSPSLRLLVGDWCYAAGLCDIAEAGDLDAVATLASVIADAAVLAGAAADGSHVAAAQRWEAGLAELAIDVPTFEE